MTEPSARQRFVEAIIELDQKQVRWLRQAVEAFADAECSGDCEWNAGGHAACRASLLRDCGLQIPVDSAAD